MRAVRNARRRLLSRRGSWLTGILLGAVLLVVTADRLFPPPELPAFSVQVFDREGDLLSAYLTADDKWRLRTRLSDVTPDFVTAIIAKEDRWFALHPGVDFPAILRALYDNVRHGRRVSGASTITMQLARLLEPGERTYLVKLREILRAFQLELRYSKRAILEQYISLLPMGGNIEGVASASWIYFNRPPEKLSLAQAVALAVLPNDPNACRLDRRSLPLQNKTRAWLKRFAERNVFDTEVIDEALGEELRAARAAPPNRASHICEQLRHRGSIDRIVTTIHPRMQRIAEQLLFNHVQRVMSDGVTNGAVLVLDNDSLNVVAYCGSADFHDAENQGQVNGVTALRSPGSTLKPFIYARAFEEGSLTPDSRLLDIPMDFGGYYPENYDGEFHGDVTVREALLQSLNIPAVSELARQGTGEAISWLDAFGFHALQKTRDQLGLSLILGGCGSTLEEVTRAYSVFARGGQLSALRYSHLELADNRKTVLSEESAFLISDILVQHERPDLPAELRESSRLPAIAWKTGTSYGKRDAWAIGWNARYTIGVWMGNFSGEGAPELSGAVMAVPLLLDLFNGIDRTGEGTGLVRPQGVKLREICARTGLLPGPQCPATASGWYIENRSTRKRCDLMKAFYVSNDQSVRYCTECVPDSGVRQDWYAVHAPELALWYAENNIERKSPPPHHPGCTARFTGDGPQILSPSSDYTYYIEQGSGQEILLHAASPVGVHHQHWYVDGMLIGEVENGGRVFFQPDASRHRITCMDDAGRERTLTIEVVYY